MRIPLLHGCDTRLIQRDYLAVTCCRTCLGSNRRHLSAIVMASIFGLTLGEIKSARWRWATHLWRERIRRTGVFDRLAADGVFAPTVDWKLVSDGHYAQRNPFKNGVPMRRIVDTYGAIVEGEQTERRRQLAQAAGGAGDGLAVRDLGVGELRNLTPAGKRLMRKRSKRGCGGGADAIAAIGEDRYTEHLDFIAQSLEAECLKMARRDRDPARRLDAWMVDYAPKQRTKLMAVPPEWIRGDTWTTFGLPASIKGGWLRLDDRRFELDGLDRVPVDVGSIRLPRIAPRISAPVPF